MLSPPRAAAAGEINAWWRSQFPDPAQAPARLTFQAGALPFGAKIELQAVAAAATPASPS